MKNFVLLLLALVTLAAFAATTYILPDPTVTVTPNYSNTTTLVTIAKVTWKGPSAYYYVSECAKPDAAGYHCSVLQEDNVVLTSPGHMPLTVTITMQSAGVLIRSGHNYWRYTNLVLAGSVTKP